MDNTRTPSVETSPGYHTLKFVKRVYFILRSRTNMPTKRLELAHVMRLIGTPRIAETLSSVVLDKSKSQEEVCSSFEKDEVKLLVPNML